MLTTGRVGLIKRGRIFFEKGKKYALQVGCFGLVFIHQVPSSLRYDATGKLVREKSIKVPGTSFGLR